MSVSTFRRTSRSRSTRRACHLPWQADRATPCADQWLESSFPGWARSILEDWADGRFDACARSCSRAATMRRSGCITTCASCSGAASSPVPSRWCSTSRGFRATPAAAYARRARQPSPRRSASTRRPGSRASDEPMRCAMASPPLAASGVQGERRQSPRARQPVRRRDRRCSATRLRWRCRHRACACCLPAARRRMSGCTTRSRARAEKSSAQLHAMRSAGSARASTPERGRHRAPSPTPCSASSGPRSFVDPAQVARRRALDASRADAVVLWLTREDEALAWHVPAQRRASRGERHAVAAADRARDGTAATVRWPRSTHSGGATAMSR